MKIENMRVSIVEKDSLRAVVSFRLDDAFYLTGMRVIEGKNGLFVSMPSKKLASGEYQDIYFPASKQAREEIVKAVLDAYFDAKETADSKKAEDIPFGGE